MFVPTEIRKTAIELWVIVFFTLLLEKGLRVWRGYSKRM